MEIEYAWRGGFDSAAVERLHAEGFGHAPVPHDWWGQVSRHSLGWVCAWADDDLVGFVNVAWDGAGHAFLVDTVVAESLQRRGVGAELVAVAMREASAAGCEWLHVDFEGRLSGFYLDACGFRPTKAGVIAL
ncbi:MULTISPECIES: GNAT family N-acetyltransferase [Actinoalloteichus]|uniref:Acetyltransferase (GNAT) family protein n=1 Tax=Actinoalloteichus fjordicus TaxID=1612552 RepID=A0AAC9LDG6_9PSEU|nr:MULTISPECIES: GNAT family N-acetyltransferase [Actinoalloteichus]APU14859.1 acetyltransferase (GNAT) family protein [Actinoalloteichus fjordicus]APU20828.1 acetyltransferase (GNAT) family protein [Actinoalloteichus sp. GBA129-24]